MDSSAANGERAKKISGTTPDKGEVWLLQLSEQLPIDPDYRPMRTSEHAEELRHRGYQVRWFTGRFDHSRKRNREVHRRDLEVSPRFRLELLRGPTYAKNFSLRRILHHSLAAIDFLLQSCNCAIPRFAIISYPAPELASAAALVCRLKRVPYFVDVRDAWPTIFRSYFGSSGGWVVMPLVWWYSFLYFFVLRGAVGVVASSESLLRDAKRYWGFGDNPHPTLVSYIGSRAPTSPRLEIPDRFEPQCPLRVVFVGTLSNSYNIPLLLEIARQVRDAGETRIEFVIIGDGENSEAWRSEVERSALSFVHFRGWLGRTRLAEELCRCHVGVLLCCGETRAYSVPNKVSEYLAHGLALLSNMRGDVADLISEADVGMTISDDQAEVAVGWLLQIVSQPSRLVELRTRAIKLYNRGFDAGKNSARFVDFVENMVHSESEATEGVATR